jgi:hypothetical protein
LASNKLQAASDWDARSLISRGYLCFKTYSIFQVPSTDGRQFDICQILKPGGQSMDRNLIQKCIAAAKKQAKNIQKLLEKASKS